MRLLPDRWSAGLWTFASRTPQPWTQLVPLASVASQRAALISATESLPRQVGGNTALYATTLAAFNYLTAHYAPDKVDTVVLMTDGGNSEPGLDLHTLLADLRHGFNRDKPVSITTIALGRDADVAALRQISAATGGRAYVLRSPKDLETGLLQSVLRGS
jgi:secreted protein with Ig-like and vWFA domain